jgi:uncharacterized delta-60 repeat protein
MGGVMKKIFLLAITSLLIQYAVIAQVSQIWTHNYNGSGSGTDKSYAMTIDKSGNCYVTGETFTSAGNNDLVIIKINSNGGTVWEKFYDGPDNNRDIGRAIAVDADGNVFVTGESYGAGNYDLLTLAFDSTGTLIWDHRYDGPANGTDGATAIAVDTSGNVYVTGYSDGDPNSVFRQDDYITIKYNSSGTVEWEMRYDGPGNYHDVAYSIAVDQNENVYVTGGSSGVGGTTRYDYATVKYNSGGNEIWVARYNHNDFNDTANEIAIDDSNNIYVTGSSDGTSLGIPNYATVKYNSAGNELWVSRYTGGGGGDEPNAIFINGSNNIYVTGQSKNTASPNNYDYLTINYNAANGDTIWTARYNGPDDDTDVATSIASDLSGNLYVTGFSRGNSTSYDYATIKYNSAGLQQWIIRYNGTGNGNDIANTVAVDNSGNIFVAGSSTGSATSDDIVTIKYSQIPTNIDDTEIGLTRSYALHQNYPNPFNPITKIKFVIPVVETGHAPSLHTKLVVFDILGQKISTLINENKQHGTYEVEFNAANLPGGIYFYKLSAGKFIETKKMLLLK